MSCSYFLLLKATIHTLLIIILIPKDNQAFLYKEFPKDFQFGIATSAYQIEGAWNINGKGVNTWDVFTHDNNSVIKDHSNGDEACDSYHKYKEDVQLLKYMGVDFYRFSLSWSRILPNGFDNFVNEDGLNYYKNLINELLANGIQPHVTLFHWDLPEDLEKLGGWTNEIIIDCFVNYARIIFRELGPKINTFFTINEPIVICIEGYGGLLQAPGKNLPETAPYLCMHNMLKAHAKVYHMYDMEFRPQQNGLISIVISSAGFYAKHKNDTEAENVAFQFLCGWPAHPIFSKTGDYPEVVKKRLGDNSKIQGYSKSRLPEFTPEWIEYIRGTADFFSLNHYTSYIVESVPRGPNDLWYRDSGINFTFDPKWPSSGSSWLKVVPEGFRKTINMITKEYDNPSIMITENGISDDGSLVDTKRIHYFSDYLKFMLQAMNEDGCKVIGYTAWSLLDNFEWQSGYTEKFGMVKVDFSSPNKSRSIKLSAIWYRNLIKERKIPNYITDNNNEIDNIFVP